MTDLADKYLDERRFTNKSPYQDSLEKWMLHYEELKTLHKQEHIDWKKKYFPNFLTY